LGQVRITRGSGLGLLSGLGIGDQELSFDRRSQIPDPDARCNKCIRTFPADVTRYPVFPDGSAWKMQGLWSNAAYQAGTGAANLNGQRACVWE
jgi:hypothetical protein